MNSTLTMGVGLAVAVIWLIASAGSASAAGTTFAGSGAGAGSVNRPTGAAVNQTSGNVYIADESNHRVDVFSASGGFRLAWGWGVADGSTASAQTCGPEASPPTAACFAGLTGGGAGETRPQSVAVDNDPGSASFGDVYVFDVSQFRVEKFSAGGAFILMFGKNVNKTAVSAGGTEAEKDLCTAASGNECQAGVSGTGNGQFSQSKAPVTVSESSGEVWVGDKNRLERFSSSGVFQSQVALAGAGETTALALDPAGGFYVKSASLAGIRRLTSAGTLTETLDAGGSPKGLAVAPDGGVFVGDATAPYRFKEFSATGVQVSQFGRGQVIGSPEGSALAIGEQAESLYSMSSAVSPNSAAQIFAVPKPGPLIEGETARSVLPTTVTLAASLNPEGHATEYHFEYGSSSVSEHSTSTETLPASGFEEEEVTAPLSHLLPATEYRFRLAAVNHCNPSQPSEECVAHGVETSFTTPPAVEVESEFASAVSASGADIGATVNPLGVGAAWWVEYGPSEGLYTGKSTGAGLPPEISPFAVLVHIGGLRPATTYHYRVVGQDVREGTTYTVPGADHVFTTQPAGVSFSLFDGRQWELVSAGATAGVPFPPAEGIVQASEGGSGFTYLSQGTATNEPEGARSPELGQVLAMHSPQGWTVKDLTTPYDVASSFHPGGAWEYRLFAPDLRSAVVEPRDGALLSDEASEQTPYLREDLTGPPVYRPVVSGKEGFANVPPGTQFGGNTITREPPGPSIEGGSRDLRYVIVGSSVPLAEGVTGQAIYEWSVESHDLTPVSVLPAAEGGEVVLGELGGGKSGVGNAVSADGRYVVWTRPGTPGAIYVFDDALGKSVRLDLPTSGATGSGTAAPLFQGASANGTEVFFTDTQQLTPDAGHGGSDLYECEISTEAGAPACVLRDLAPAPGPGESAEVQGLVAGMSSDGGSIYLVANGVLAPGAALGNCAGGAPATAGCSLYLLLHDPGSGSWSTRFIARLSNEDEADWGVEAQVTPAAGHRVAESSPSGSWFAFMSDRPLTGYDNVDAVSGVRDEEVFVYDAVGEALTCASCNPSGSRPKGVLDESSTQPLPSWAIDPTAVWNGHWLSALLPDPSQMSVEGRSAGQPRFVLDDGRVFFNSVDSLVPADANSGGDVYEYEPTGVGGCTSSPDSNSDIASLTGGCVAMLSGGTSAFEAGFLDASSNGDDVFFLGAAGLTAADSESETGVYDAHVCGLGWECQPASSALPGPCESAGSCRAAAAEPGQPTATPGSAGFSGPGNEAPQKKQQPRHKKKHHNSHHKKKRKHGKTPSGNARRTDAEAARSTSRHGDSK